MEECVSQIWGFHNSTPGSIDSGTDCLGISARWGASTDIELTPHGAQMGINWQGDLKKYIKYLQNGLDKHKGSVLNISPSDTRSMQCMAPIGSFNTTVRAAHFAFLLFFPPAAQDIAENNITLSDIQKVTEQLNIYWNTTGNGYNIEQTTKPNGIGLALYDSPQAAGQLAWIGGKFKLCEYPFSKLARSSRLNRV
ncbi:hypothetical protein B0H14DRAFT_2622986 [Mycena olivaceomarginata]|nr:hypothetical protein B0H14DRAFT_2622986 [Mycena olivaceomarginata]